MKPYDIVFFQNDSIISKIIKWFTKSQYSHVGILTYDLNVVFDIQLVGRSTYRKIKNRDKIDIYRLNAEVDENQALSWIMNHGNLKYDLGEIVKIVFNKKTRDDDNKFICSTLVLDFIRNCTDMKVDENLYIVSPQDLIDLNLVTKVCD